MSVTNRAGVGPAVGSLSIRSKTTVAGSGSFAFFDTKTRPAPVATHSVFASAFVRWLTETYVPALSVPYVALDAVMRPAGLGSPSAFQSSHESPGRSYVPLLLRSAKCPFHTL